MEKFGLGQPKEEVKSSSATKTSPRPLDQAIEKGLEKLFKKR
jgi:hypothetical protein